MEPWWLIRDGLICTGITLLVLIGICVWNERDKAKCKLCGQEGPRIGMYHHRVYGWYCNEAEYLEMRRDWRGEVEE